jgi:hypothetical protein
MDRLHVTLEEKVNSIGWIPFQPIKIGVWKQTSLFYTEQDVNERLGSRRSILTGNIPIKRAVQVIARQVLQSAFNV